MCRPMSHNLTLCVGVCVCVCVCRGGCVGVCVVVYVCPPDSYVGGGQCHVYQTR